VLYVGVYEVQECLTLRDCWLSRQQTKHF